MDKTLDAAEIISWCFAGDIPCGADPAAAIEAHGRALEHGEALPPEAWPEHPEQTTAAFGAATLAGIASSAGGTRDRVGTKPRVEGLPVVSARGHVFRNNFTAPAFQVRGCFFAPPNRKAARRRAWGSTAGPNRGADTRPTTRLANQRSGPGEVAGWGRRFAGGLSMAASEGHGPRPQRD